MNFEKVIDRTISLAADSYLEAGEDANKIDPEAAMNTFMKRSAVNGARACGQRP